MSLFSLFDRQVPGPRIERIRHESKVHTVQVSTIEQLTPGMLRVTFAGDELSDFVSLAPDDHIKLFIPAPDGDAARRYYTPRSHDPQAGTLAIDFALHDAGPATQWARNARPGDMLRIRSPKGSAVISPDVRRWLLVGDETALPAIGRRIEESPEGTAITSIVAVASHEEHQIFGTAAQLTTHWAHRPLSAANDPAALLAILQTIELAPDIFVWVAAEAHVARAVRAHIIEQKAHPKGWLKAGGYWIAGKADAHERFD